MYGHSHDVWAVAFHPAKPRVCVTVCDGSRVYVWDVARRDLVRAATVGFTARAVTVSSQGYGPSGSFHIAVGADNGKMKVSAVFNLGGVCKGPWHRWGWDLMTDNGGFHSGSKWNP
jgi:WD40 repeat protein